VEPVVVEVVSIQNDSILLSHDEIIPVIADPNYFDVQPLQLEGVHPPLYDVPALGLEEVLVVQQPVVPLDILPAPAVVPGSAAQYDVPFLYVDEQSQVGSSAFESFAGNQHFSVAGPSLAAAIDCAPIVLQQQAASSSGISAFVAGAAVMTGVYAALAAGVYVYQVRKNKVAQAAGVEQV